MNRSEANLFSSARATFFVLIYMCLIFVTLPIAPRIVSTLQQYGPIGLIVNSAISIFLLLAIAIAAIRKRFLRWPLILIFIPLGIITIWALNHIKLPIERVHVVEYGVLSMLLFPICERHTHVFIAIAQSLFLASLAGYIDECIQYFLPNRFFTWEDVYLNAVGALTGLVYFGIYRWATKT